MSKELNLATGTTGQTITANVYLLGVVKATAIACDEIGVTGAYAGDFSAIPNVAGVYHVTFFAGGTVCVGEGQIAWDGSAEVMQTGDNFARLGAPAGASLSIDVAAVKTDTAAVKTQTDKLAFTVTNQIDANVIDWKGVAAPAMTGDAYARIGAAGAGLTAMGDTRLAHLDADVSSAVGSGPSAADIADAVWDEILSAHAIAGSTGAGLTSAIPGAVGTGTGSTEWNYTLTDSRTGIPIPEADVWVTNDYAGHNLLASGRTNQFGVVTFFLDPGAVFIFSNKPGFNFSNPQSRNVT